VNPTKFSYAMLAIDGLHDSVANGWTSAELDVFTTPRKAEHKETNNSEAAMAWVVDPRDVDSSGSPDPNPDDDLWLLFTE